MSARKLARKRRLRCEHRAEVIDQMILGDEESPRIIDDCCPDCGHRFSKEEEAMWGIVHFFTYKELERLENF